MDPTANTLPDDQRWPITFLGGTADLDEAPVAPPRPPSTLPEVCLPLAMATIGDRVWVVQVNGGQKMVRRLTNMGIVPGVEITIVNRTESGSVIVGLQNCRIGLGAGMAHRVTVTTQQETSPSVPAETATPHAIGEPHMTSNMTSTALKLGDLAVGQSGRILGYEPGCRAYRGKLLSMGLTPGTHFTVTRHAPMGDPVEVEVRGFKLSLRKGEAAALRVEPLSPEEASHE